MFDLSNVKKVIYYVKLYGFRRTLTKLIGRNRSLVSIIPRIDFLKKNKNVSLIGAGQYSFSTISYFIKVSQGFIIKNIYDIDENASIALASYYNCKSIDNENDFFNMIGKYLFISSNHSTHTYYAIKAMSLGVNNIFIEKPVSVTYKSFVELNSWKKKTSANIIVGYNRPFSDAIKILKSYSTFSNNEPFSITYHINGHKIPKDHWYRNEEEGTRICGNLGHWIDLTVHIWNWRNNFPEIININVIYADKNEPDDNIVVVFQTDMNDIVTMVLTSRSEPFEGIFESINFQYNDIIANIQDFRKIIIWKGATKKVKKFFPKDVGHKASILRFWSNESRDWGEIVLSTLLMLKITEMVRNKQELYKFHVTKHLIEFENDVNEL